MKEKLEWLKLLVPGAMLSALIVGSMLGNGPKLQEIPEKLVKEKVEAEAVKTPAPIKVENLKTKKDKKEKKAETKKLAFKASENGYKDGTYYGSATGFGGNIQVSVTVKDEKITSVQIVSASGETPSFLSRAKSILGSIVSAQSPNVDVVSGATYTSNGIINATIQALKQAGAENLTTKATKTESPKTTAAPKKKKNSEKKKKDLENVVYANGTYYGTGEGYGGTIKAKVVIKKNKISDIQIVSAPYETPEYFAKAKAILTTMKKKQTSDVDVISGATYTSNGIIDAVYEALEAAAAKAKKKKPTATPTVAPTVMPTVTPSPTSEPETGITGTDPNGNVTILEDGSTCTETRTEYTKEVIGNAMCNPDDEEEFDGYSIDLILSVKGEKIHRVIEKDGVQTTEDEHIFSVTNIVFSDATQEAAINDGNWFYLKRAANGYSTKKGVFEQLLLPTEPESVDAVSGATCSSQAIIAAYKNGIGQLEQ